MIEGIDEINLPGVSRHNTAARCTRYQISPRSDNLIVYPAGQTHRWLSASVENTTRTISSCNKSLNANILAEIFIESGDVI